MRVIVPLLAALLLGLPVKASELAIDSFSFIHFPGTQFTSSLPADLSLPLEITQKRPGVWNLKVRASAVPARGTITPDGRAIGIALNGDGGGECVANDGGLQCKLLLVLVVVEKTSGKSLYVPVSFSTEIASKSSALAEASRAGARLDPKSRFVQLAGVGEVPPEYGRMGGEPFYVVLSGVVDTLPAAMQAPPPALE